MPNGECKGASEKGDPPAPEGARKEQAILPEEVLLQRVGEGGEFRGEKRERRVVLGFGEI